MRPWTQKGTQYTLIIFIIHRRTNDEIAFTEYAQDAIELIIIWSCNHYKIELIVILVDQILDYSLLDLSTSSNMSSIPTFKLIASVFRVLQIQHQIPSSFVSNLIKQSLAILKEVFSMSAVFPEVFAAIIDCLFHPFVLSNEAYSHDLQDVYIYSIINKIIVLFI